jgi:hypothetical protein
MSPGVDLGPPASIRTISVSTRETCEMVYLKITL